MYCEQCNMLIHEAEIRWSEVNGYEIPFCPIHRESLEFN